MLSLGPQRQQLTGVCVCFKDSSIQGYFYFFYFPFISCMQDTKPAEYKDPGSVPVLMQKTVIQHEIYSLNWG